MPAPLSPDQRVARRAARHHGLVTRALALASGLTDRQIARRVERGVWVRLSPGVFRIEGAPVTAAQQAYAAVLAAGPHAVVGGRSALALFNLCEAPTLPSITVPPTASARTRLALVRRSMLTPADRTSVGPVPCVTASRGLVEVSRRADASSVQKLLDGALHRRLARPATVLAALRRSGGLQGRPGSARLMEALEPWMRGVTPGSPGEVRLLRCIDDWGLPRPVLQYQVVLTNQRVFIDVAWPHHRIGLEYDGAEFHGPRELGHDVEREEALRAAGWWIGRLDRLDLAPSSTRVRDELSARLLRRAA